MKPSERTFLSAVVRFQTLLHGNGLRRDAELVHLRRFLSSDAPDAVREAGCRRQFRRFALRVPAQLRGGEQDIPCTIVDLGGGGMRLEGRAAAGLRGGEAVVLSVQVEGNGRRLDFPAVVRFVAPGGTWAGMEFSGAPLTVRQHHARAEALGPKGKTQEVCAAAA